MKVERFFHIRTEYQFGGATIRVTGDTDHVGQVEIQSTICSRNDPFCKKTGRETALKAPVKIVPLRYLPQELARIEDKMRDQTRLSAVALDYTYSLRYFLPKE